MIEIGEIGEIFSLISQVSKTAQDIKGAYNSVSQTAWFPPRRSLVELENKIRLIEGQIASLQKSANTGFPQLAKLVRDYSDLISNVRIARALSDKLFEIYGLAPDLISRTTTMFANEMQAEYSRISSSVHKLPDFDFAEKGRIEAKLDMIRDLVIEMKKTNDRDVNAIKRILDSISTQYSDIESTLSRFLEKVLNQLEKSSKV